MNTGARRALGLGIALGGGSDESGSDRGGELGSTACPVAEREIGARCTLDGRGMLLAGGNVARPPCSEARADTGAGRALGRGMMLAGGTEARTSCFPSERPSGRRGALSAAFAFAADGAAAAAGCRGAALDTAAGRGVCVGTTGGNDLARVACVATGDDMGAGRPLGFVARLGILLGLVLGADDHA